MNDNRKLALGKILIIIIVIGIGGGIMAYGIQFFTTDEWKPSKDTHRVNTIIPLLGGSFQIGFHNDFGIIPGSYLDGDIFATIPVPNDTKVAVTLPDGYIPGESNYTAGLASADKIPLNFTSKGSLQANQFHAKISGLSYQYPGNFHAILITTKNNTSHEYRINDTISIQPYSFYESQKNEYISQGLLYFTAGLVFISVSPVLVQLYQYIHDFRKKNMWEMWIKENSNEYKKIKLSLTRKKIIYFSIGFGVGALDHFGLWYGSTYQQSTTVMQVIVAVTSAIASPLVYAAILILLIFATSLPIFFRGIGDTNSRPIYLAMAGLATSLAVFDLILVTTDVCHFPFYAHFGKCANL